MNGNGLEGVVVADTSLSEVNGEAGELLIAGTPVGQLAAQRGFAETCALLWAAADPNVTISGVEVQKALGAGRVAAFTRISSLGDALARRDAMDALRAAIAHLEPFRDRFPMDAAEVTAAVAVYAAAFHRQSYGLPLLPPDPDADHAQDFLRMLTGRATDPARARALDAYLTTVIDHGMNASAFAARVVASTESDLVSAVVAALGALKGRLHGGAPGPVLDMLDAIGSAANAEPFVRAELAAGRRIMGMGHRVYRVRDPRAAVLEYAVTSLRGQSSATDRVALARAVEEAATRVLAEHKPDRRIRANVEFYTAIILDAVGIPRELFTATFACSRVAGWCAHVAEQRRTGRLIRPRARYVGPRPAA